MVCGDRVEYARHTFQVDVPVSFAETTTETATEEGSSDVELDFKGQANSGAPFDHWLFGKAAVDMKTLSINRQDLPVLRDHDTSQIAGFTKKIKADNEGINVEGVVFDATEAGRDAITLLQRKFPLQMSVYVPAGTILRLAEDEEANVNGHTMKGPGAIFKYATLREVTLTALGADENTSAELLSGGTDGQPMVQVQETRMTEHDKPSTPDLTVDSLKLQHEGVYRSVIEEGRKAERERVAFIRSKARGVSTELVDKAIEENWDEHKTLSEFLDYSTDRKEARLSTLRDETKDRSVGNDDGDPEQEETFVENAQNEAMLADMDEGEEKWKLQWAADKELREKFLNDESLYLARQRHMAV